MKRLLPLQHLAQDQLGPARLVRRLCSIGAPGSRFVAGALLLAAFACQRTADGLEQDSREASERARESAADAKRSLDREVGAFKTQADAKLQELTVSINALKAQAQTNVEGSRQKLEAELNGTRQQLSQLKADSSTEWQKAKHVLEQRIAELGRELNQTLDKAGGGLDRAGDKVEHALQPSAPKPADTPPQK
jgi:DNA anti-recombination protein RmuC